MNCPRCNSTLEKETINDVKVSIQVDSCKKCGGTWFCNGELSQIEGLIDPVLIEVRKIPNKQDQIKQLKCPSCQTSRTMQKFEHARDKKVILDNCLNCKGIWLDKGELEAIQKESWITTIGKLIRWLALGE